MRPRQRVRTKMKFAVAGIAALSLMLAACGGGGSGSDGAAGGDGKPVAGGTMTIAVEAQPGAGGLDPQVVANSAAYRILLQTYGTLLTRDDKGTIQPGLASSYKQVDPLTVDFTLRSGVKFSNGDPLTPDDVIFTFQSYQKGTSNSKAYLKNLESITAKGTDTVEFKFASPNGTFLNATSNRTTFLILNKKWYESKTPDERQRQTMGTGPYMLDKWTDNVEITMKKNPNYWDSPKPYIDTLDFKIIPDETARLTLLQQGGADAGDFGDAQIAEQAKQAGFTMGEIPYTGKLSIFVNPAKGSPLADVRVRQAVSLAMDRPQLIKLGLNGFGKESLFTVYGDPSSPRPDASTPFYTHDVAKAKQLLAEAGQPNPTIQLAYPSDVNMQQIPLFETMKEQLAAAGITLDLKATPWAEVSKTFTYGESFKDLIAFGNIFGADSTGYFNQYLSDAGLLNHWKGNPDAKPAQELLAQLTTETDLAKRKQMTLQLDNMVAQNVLNIVPAAFPQTIEVWNTSKVHNYKSDPYSFKYNLPGAWVSK